MHSSHEAPKPIRVTASSIFSVYRHPAPVKPEGRLTGAGNPPVFHSAIAGAVTPRISSQCMRMGIDIYASWQGQTEAEREAQYTGFSVVHGHVGYLREAYHGEPYATKYLVAEAFARPETGAAIPAAVLRERLPETLRLAEERERTVYGVSDPEELADVKRAFVDFVELCEAKERKTGRACTILASF